MADAELCRFYSPDWLGTLLIQSVGEISPRTVLDLGSGGGCLTAAAAKSWGAAEFISVDVDAAAGRRAAEQLAQFPSLRHRHINVDVLRPDLSVALGTADESLDLVLSNPPYRSAATTVETSLILKRCGLTEETPCRGVVPLDVLFLGQAIRMVRPGGRIGLIAPDSLVTGRHLKNVRAQLLARHSIERVVQLPRRAFKGTDAQAYIIIIRKGGVTGSVCLENAFSPPEKSILIPHKLAAERMDYGHYTNAELYSQGTSLRDLGVIIKRGRITSNRLHTLGSTFHTNAFPKLGDPPDIDLPQFDKENLSRNDVICEPSDILVARVDRRLEEKIAVIRSGGAHLSDCVFRLRCPDGETARVLTGLLSECGRLQLIAQASGTGARHISAEALLNVCV